MLLDDSRHFGTIDKKGMMAHILGLRRQIEESLEAAAALELPRDYSECSRIVTLGMGGSGIPGDFLQALYSHVCPVPISVRKDYGLPPFVGPDTLVLAVSYTGTTDETFHACREAVARKARIVGVTGGDRLQALLKERGFPYIAPSPGRATRACFGYLLFALIKVLEKLGYIPDQRPDIEATLPLLERLASAYGPDAPTSANEAKGMAARLHERLPVIYGSADLTDVVALRWKQQINENSKALAYAEVFPDCTHNQLAAIGCPSGTGYELGVVMLRNSHERAELGQRITAVKTVLLSRGIDVIEHWGEGDSLMAGLLSQNHLGDFVSYYLAILRGEDPTPTIAMSDLKKALGLTDMSP